MQILTPAMILHPPTLLFCSVLAMVLSAGLMTLFGLSQRVYRGYGWWTAAQWLSALGLALQLFRDTAPELLPLSNLLLLQWPVTVMAGLRRFYPRDHLNFCAPCDWLLLGAAYLLWLTSWVARADVALRVAAFSAGAAVLLLYTVLLLWRLKDFAASPALKTLAGAMLIACGVHLWRLAASTSAAADLHAIQHILLAGGLVSVLFSMLMLYLALLLTCERTRLDLAESQRQLRELANMDSLTAVPNRRHFHELAARALAAAGPAESSALLMIDVDHFKAINDQLGHKVGDEALRRVAGSLRDSLRARDVGGRLGGDEFVALLPGTSVQDAVAVAARIVDPLGTACALPLSLSVGVVQMHPGESVDDALHRADQALYEAKRQGRSRAVVATGDSPEPVFAPSRPLGWMPI